MSDAADRDPARSPRLIGMVHLGALPGSPNFTGDFEAVLELAVSDSLTLRDAGFDALMIENYGDVPFFQDDVPHITIAAMARAVATIRAAVDIPLGVNVLRNDGLAALAVAATCGAQFIRVNVLAGSMYTDQGLVNGRAAEIMRARTAWAPAIEVLADVFVKHATPPGGLTIEQAAADTYHRGLADALIVSGSTTGRAPDQKTIDKVRSAVPDAPLLIGSGATSRRVGALLQMADGVIVGTNLKVKGIVENPVDPQRAATMVKAAAATGTEAGDAPPTKRPRKKPDGKPARGKGTQQRK